MSIEDMGGPSGEMLGTLSPEELASRLFEGNYSWSTVIQQLEAALAVAREKQRVAQEANNFPLPTEVRTRPLDMDQDE